MKKNAFLKVDYVEPVYYANCFTTPTLSRASSALKGVNVWINGDGHFFECDRYSVCDPDAAIEDGRRQVVSLAKELGEMKFADRNGLFGNYTVPDILNHRSYEQIVEMLKDWKKEQETIRVRDEVCHQSMQVKFVVTKIFVPSGGEDAIVNGIKKDGTAIKGLLLRNVKKTGLHVDDLDSYLEV